VALEKYERLFPPWKPGGTNRSRTRVSPATPEEPLRKKAASFSSVPEHTPACSGSAALYLNLKTTAHYHPLHDRPPSTGRVMPVMNFDSSDARKSAAYATCHVPLVQHGHGRVPHPDEVGLGRAQPLGDQLDRHRRVEPALPSEGRGLYIPLISVVIFSYSGSKEFSSPHRGYP
jgi:hypothetical protein